ncbi:MAG: hypothetical protein ACJ8G7_24440, partial [Rhizobacter sp.]
RRTRWLLAWSQRLADDLAPQWLLYDSGEHGESTRLGVNLTRLLSKACVAQFEWSGGRVPSLLGRAAGQPEQGLAFRSQLASGLTCSNAHTQSLTLELQRNGEALDNAGWQALRDGPAPLYLDYRQQAQRRQDPATRYRLLALAGWQNALVPQLDLNGFLLWSPADRSHELWLEARYRMGSTDFAVQLQANAGDPSSEQGAIPQRRVLQLLLRQHF